MTKPVVPHTNHMTDHPITPPPELVRQWQRDANHDEPMFPQIANQAAQWGADQQLAAVATWLDHNILDTPHLRITPIGETLIAAMRPKPPTLKEQALAVLDDCSGRLDGAHENIIRRALEELPND